MANGLPGRPGFTDEDYKDFLDDLKPFLKMGKSLYNACEKAHLERQYRAIMNKYNLKDWFYSKVQEYQGEIGELANDLFYSLIVDLHGKVKRGEKLNEIENKQAMFVAERHRSAQKYFVNRFETAKGRPVEEVLGDLENKVAEENVDDVVENLQQLAEEARSEPLQQAAPQQPVIQPDPNNIDPNATIST